MANITVCEILEDNVPGLQAVDPDAARRFGGNASVVDGTTPLVSKIKEWVSGEPLAMRASCECRTVRCGCPW